MVLLAQKVAQPLLLYRGCVSVGAVGATAPTDLEESSFCTLDFQTEISLAIFLELIRKSEPTVLKS